MIRVIILQSSNFPQYVDMRTLVALGDFVSYLGMLLADSFRVYLSNKFRYIGSVSCRLEKDCEDKNILTERRNVLM